MLESGWSAGSSSSCWNAMTAWAWRSEARVTLVQVCDSLVLTSGSTGRAPGPAVAPPVDSPPMTNLDEQGRPEPPLAADETATLLGFLEYQRATLAWKCGGLDTAGLRATVAASSMTLGGLLKHLAYVEDLWCSRWLHGRDRQPPWDKVDWKADPDWDWHSAAEDSPEQLQTLWQDAVARSRSLVTEALADGRAPSLRWILFHMIEEYARHNGHADLLRESVDGLTGESPPGGQPHLDE